MIAPIDSPDYRHFPRHKLPAERLCFVHTPGCRDFWPAFLIDLSRGGVRIFTSRQHWEVGTTLPLQLLCRDSCRRFTKVLRVLHSQKAVPGHWVTGGTFLRPLTTQELESAIGPEEVARKTPRLFSWWDRREVGVGLAR
jgi:hypothetical protein